MTDMEKAKDGCTAILLAFALAPLLVFVRGWALATHWGWFMVPLGVPALGWAHASGIACLFGLLSASGKHAEKKEDVSHVAHTLTLMVGHLLVAFVSVGMGWALVRFM